MNIPHLRPALFAAAWLAASLALAADFPAFEYHEIDRIGNQMGQTSLVDVDKDGKLDWIAGCSHGDVWWFQYQSPDRWVRHKIGGGVGTEVGGLAMDVDGDGWVDQVSGSTWFRNPGSPADKEFTKFSNGAISNSHDNVAADVDRDGKPDVVMIQGTAAVYWYKIPADPTQPWESHEVGPAVHGGIGPRGVGDIDGDGDPDIVRSTGWFENVDGKGTAWTWHGNIEGGHGGRFPDTTKCWIIDLNRDGRNDVVLSDAEVVPGQGRAHWFENQDGKGGAWVRHAIASGKGDMHTLFVGDFNNDGRPDVFSGEGPMGGTGEAGKRRWFVWENVDGRGGQWKEHIILEGPECHEGVAADVDGDGDLDICSKPWNGNLHVYLRNMLVESGGRESGRPPITPLSPRGRGVGGEGAVGADQEGIVFIPEMEPIPDMDISSAASRWTADDDAKYADDLSRAAKAWKDRIPEIQSRVTPEQVRSLSRWAKPQMESYQGVPPLEKVNLKPIAVDRQKERLILEGTVDTLPSHAPLVTRWLKVYVLYDVPSKSLARVAVTIRGERLE